MARTTKNALTGVNFTHVGKVFFPKTGFTKGDLIRYYLEIAPVMVPHLARRPVTLIRMPDGVQGERFYAKNAPAYAPKWLPTTVVAKSDGEINYITIDDTRTLAWCANNAAVELHPFLHRADDLERPTHAAFDLDPGEGADLLTCIEVGFLVKDVLAGLGLEAFPKVSGSKGLQLYVPLNTPVTYETVSPFAKAIAELLHRRHPDLVVSDMSKALRVKRVLIDWSQNHAKKTTVGAYSVRGKRDEPFVSMPVSWDELKRAQKAGKTDRLFFAPDEALKRVKQKGDLFAPVLKLKQKLPAKVLDALGVEPAAKPTARARRKKTGKKQDEKKVPKSARAKRERVVKRESKRAPGAVPRSLRTYAKKRDFSLTAEPGPDRLPATAAGRRFVIQKHDASRLHYDFRLEMDGVLKSWAVPKGLATELHVKRAAFQVEDHPLAYFSFEGTIPQGQYGGGTVMVWDIGTYEILGGDYAKGDLKLRLAGKKLKGEWHIFRIKTDEAKPVWLIAKAKEPARPLTKKQETTSVVSGRTLEQIAAAGDAVWNSDRAAKAEAPARRRATMKTPARQPRAKRPPAFVAPMTAREVAELPNDGAWLYEIKLDGYRALAAKHGATVRVVSRQKKSLSRAHPEVVEAMKTVAADSVLLDGEIVALDRAGKPSFPLLQNRKARSDAVVYYAFDLLHLNGEDWRPRPIEERKAKLAEVLAGSEVRFSAAFDGPADKILAGVEEMELEGVVAKRRGSPYESGERSGAWVKYKRTTRREFVIGGYLRGAPLSALVVGYQEAARLYFAGVVRQGLTPRLRRELAADLKPLQADISPFADLTASKAGRLPSGLSRKELKNVQWAMPRLVAQVTVADWSEGQSLKNATFQGLRQDRDAKGVGRGG